MELVSQQIPFALELAGHDALAPIVALLNTPYGGGQSGRWSTSEAYVAGNRTSEALLRAETEKNASAVLLKLTRNGECIVGCVMLEQLDESVWYLGSLAIDPDMQTGGLGRQLLGAAEDWMRARGAKQVRISVVNIRETLLAWYRRRGYLETGAFEPFPFEDNRLGKAIRNDLRLIILEKAL